MKNMSRAFICRMRDYKWVESFLWFVRPDYSLTYATWWASVRIWLTNTSLVYCRSTIRVNQREKTRIKQKCFIQNDRQICHTKKCSGEEKTFHNRMRHTHTSQRTQIIRISIYAWTSRKNHSQIFYRPMVYSSRSIPQMYCIKRI